MSKNVGSEEGNTISNLYKIYIHKLIIAIYVSGLICVLVLIVFTVPTKREATDPKKIVDIHDEPLFVKESDVEIQKRKKILEEARQLVNAIEEEQSRKRIVEEERAEIERKQKEAAKRRQEEIEENKRKELELIEAQKVARQQAWNERDRQKAESKSRNSQVATMADWAKSSYDNRLDFCIDFITVVMQREGQTPTENLVILNAYGLEEAISTAHKTGIPDNMEVVDVAVGCWIFMNE